VGGGRRGETTLAGRGGGDVKGIERGAVDALRGWRRVAEGEKKNIGSERSPGTFRQINSGTH